MYYLGQIIYDFKGFLPTLNRKEMSPFRQKNILLVDDHALFRAGLRLILQIKIDAEIIEIEKISDKNGIAIESIDPILICKTVQSLLNNRLPSDNRHIDTSSSSAITQAKNMLSPRFLEVLDFVAEGRSNKYIADRLSLSEHTVRNHIATLMDHFEVNNRTKIIVAA